MFKSIYDRIDNLEHEYNSGLKEYIRSILTRLSNDSTICEYGELKRIGDFKFIITNTFCVQQCFTEIFEFNTDNSFHILYDDIKFKSYEFIRISDVFGSNTKLIDVINTIEYIISIKDICGNLKPKFDNAINYIDCLINNLKSLSYYIPIDYEKLEDDNIFFNKIPDLLDNVSNSLTVGSFFDLNSHTGTSFSTESEDVNSSDEEKTLNEAKSWRDGLKNIGKLVLNIKTKIDQGKLNVKHFMDKMNLMRDMFYRKNLGKIDHMFERYGGEAEIVESKLNGDPTTILMEKCGPYLAQVVDGAVDVYHHYNNHMNKLFECTSMPDMIKHINSYLTLEDVKLTNKSSDGEIKTALVKDLRYKMAGILLNDNKVYGYTVDSIVQKSYPPIKHLMVCLFCENPQEKPFTQKVNEIFDSGKSFKIMGKKFKEVVLESSRIVSEKLKNVSVEDDFKRVSAHMNIFIVNNKKSINTGHDNDKNHHPDDRKKDLARRISILKDHRGVMESFIPLFIYVSDAGNAMYDISLKIDYTCRDAVKGLLNIESGAKDSNYKHNLGTNAKYQNSQTKAAQKENGFDKKGNISKSEVSKKVKAAKQDIRQDNTIKYY